MRFHFGWKLGAVVLILISGKINAQEVMFTINGVPAYSDEFEYAYSKNGFNNPDAFEKKDLENYFELYLNFKLKVAEAKALGLDTIRSLKNEFESYKVQIRKPYMSDDKVTDSLVRQAYERLKTEVNASHILLRLPPEPLPEDTLKVYQRLIQIRKELLEGADFSEMARKYSQDPGGQYNGGNLGYFTSMQMVYPFEHAAFSLAPGEISQPVRTQFGYHLIKVNGKRPSMGRVKASHIMVRFSRNMSGEDSLARRNKIFEIAQLLSEGADWDEMCRVYSEDAASKMKGGVLQPFRTGNMPPAFSEAALNLQNPGDISDPVMTPYGWHIIKLDEILGIEEFEEVESKIRSRINSDFRSNIKTKALVAKLVKENDVEFKPEYQNLRNRVLNEVDSMELRKELFTISGKDYSTKDIMPSGNGDMTVNEVFQKFIVDYEEDHLVEKYPEYRNLLNEYWEGILLFQVMEQEVWNRAIEDTVGLESFFKDNAKRYKWKERLAGNLYRTSNKEVIDSLQVFLNNKPDSLTPRDIVKIFNEKSALALNLQEGPFETGDERLPVKIQWEPGVQSGKEENLFFLLEVEAILPPGPKKLAETKGLVISDYQDYLENIWLTNLRRKHEIEINKKTVKNVIRKLEK